MELSSGCLYMGAAGAGFEGDAAGRIVVGTSAGNLCTINSFRKNYECACTYHDVCGKMSDKKTSYAFLLRTVLCLDWLRGRQCDEFLLQSFLRLSKSGVHLTPVAN